MEKIILTKKQSEIIESYKKSHNLITILNRAEKRFACTGHQEMNKLSLEEIASAWINGYEVEETTEEEILKEFENFIKKRNENVIGQKCKDAYHYYDGKIDGMRLVLDILYIKIEGINC